MPPEDHRSRRNIMRKVPPAGLTLLVLLSVVGCATIDPALPVADDPVPVPRPPNAWECPQARSGSAQAEVGPEGAYIVVGRHLLDVPPRGEPGVRRFRMRSYAEGYIRVYISPSNDASAGRFRLTLSTAGCERQPEPGQVLAIARFHNGAWEIVGRGAATARDRPYEASVTVDRETASSYALIAP
jgi:hypothetical protein